MPVRSSTPLDELLAVQLTPGECTFASGEVANNHLNFDYHQMIPTHRPIVAQHLCGLLSRLDIVPAFIAPVPSGGIGWAEVAASHYSPESPLITLTKHGKRDFSPSEEVREQAERLQGERGIVIDDVTTDGGTSEVYAENIEALGLKVAVVISVLLRGKVYGKSRFTRMPVYYRYIPFQLNWQIYQDTGKIVEL